MKYHTFLLIVGWGEKPPIEEVLKVLRDWRSLPKKKLLHAFEAGHFAGIEEMKRSEQLLSRVAPLAVNDIMMAVQYKYDHNYPPLSIPILAFEGAQDNTIPKNLMREWKIHTTQQFSKIIINSNHYFVSSRYMEITNHISEACINLLAEKDTFLKSGHSWVGEEQVSSQETGLETIKLKTIAEKPPLPLRQALVVLLIEAFVFILLWRMWYSINIMHK